MTEEPGDGRPDGEAGSTAETEAVRRLLADARHTGPPPPDVVSRMDAVLADLAPLSSREATAPVHPVVVSLTAQRRRRAAALLVAAAAIVVGGVVVAQHLPSSGSQSSASASAGDRSETDSLANGDAAGAAPTAPGTQAPRAAGGAAPVIRAGRVRVRPSHFTNDALVARRLVDRKAPAPRGAGLAAAGASCVVTRTPGSRVAATYEGAPAVLVFHPPVSTAQVVDLYLCGSRRPLRSSTLPSP